MARSFSLHSTIAILCSAIAAAVSTAFVAVCRTIDTFSVYVTSWLVKASKPFKVEAKNLPGPLVVLLRMKQYVLRQIKRERPSMTQGWRMAPST